jgi:saccharopine dehydrogenase-like NADP-dependent oxidoreductase
MKALLIGCGEMGEEALRDLVEFGGFEELRVGTRTASRAEAVVKNMKQNGTRIAIHELDASDVDSVARLMSGCDVAVNCAGPNYKYELPVAFAAIDSKTNLVDINDEYEITPKMFDLDELARKANILVVLGLGGCPGIDNVLVRSAANRLDEVAEIRTAWVMSGADPGGLALSYHLLYSLSDKAFTVHDGKMIEVQSFKDGREKLTFSEPVGEVDVFHIGHPEPITLWRTFPNAQLVENKATFVPAEVNELILRLGRVIRGEEEPFRANGWVIDSMDPAARHLHKTCKNLENVRPEAALRVEVGGVKKGKHRKVIFSSVGRLARATGIPASIGAIMISRDKTKMKGVHPPEACIEPNDFLYEILDRRNVAQLNGWIED